MPATLTVATPSTHRNSDDVCTSPRFLRQSSSSNLMNRRRVSIQAVATAVDTRRPASSLYEVLRVEQNASPTAIKSAYRNLAKIYHPDVVARRSPVSEDGDFIEIHNAYETLSDLSARATYDLSLTAAHGGRHRRFGSPMTPNRYSGFNPSRRWETDQCW